MRIASIIIVVIALAAAGVAWAGIPDGSGAIHGCYAAKGGALRVIDTGDSCTQDEVALSWSQTGPQGPPGPAATLGAGSVGSDQLADGAVTASKIAKGALGKMTAVDETGFTSGKAVAMREIGYMPIGKLTPHLDTPGSLLFEAGVSIRNPTPHAILISVGLLMNGKAEEGTFRQTIPARSEQIVSVPILCNAMPAGDYRAELTVSLLHGGGGVGPSPSVRSTTFDAMSFRPIFNPPL